MNARYTTSRPHGLMTWQLAWPERVRVIVVQAHCEQSAALEFIDCFASFEKNAAAIPSDYDGLLNFAACNAPGLAPAIKSVARCCTVGLSPDELPADEWLDVHALVFLYLVRNPGSSYSEAWRYVDEIRNYVDTRSSEGADTYGRNRSED